MDKKLEHDDAHPFDVKITRNKKDGKTVIPNSLESLSRMQNASDSDDALKASLELGWMNEVQELRTTFYSFGLAAVIALFCWYVHWDSVIKTR